MGLDFKAHGSRRKARVGKVSDFKCQGMTDNIRMIDVSVTIKIDRIP